MGADNDRLIKIGEAQDEVEAGIWRDTLEREGISVFIRRLDPLASFGVSSLLSGLEVFVLERDERRARWLLGDSPGRGQRSSL